MSNAAHTKSFAEFLRDCGRIVVPRIQRDYAQGLDSQADVRDSFLRALHHALTLPPEDERLPLNLDFIYGSMEGDSRRAFLPLDGQQRLTTLFLLHWYLAWRDNRLSEFRELVCEGKESRFSYRVRPSAKEFFDALARFDPGGEPDAVTSLREFMEDQPWFFLYWRLDPTIQAALSMLDAMHRRFGRTAEFYGRLVDDARPVITFQVLLLEDFGLSDDLYIKMNARGMPLTPFETFKASFEEHLKTLYPTELRRIADQDVSVPEYFARRIDGRWTDFFWRHREPKSDTIDNAVMNFLWTLVRASLDPDRPGFYDEAMQLRYEHVSVTFKSFHQRGWLTRPLADKLMCILDAWSMERGSGLARQLPNGTYFDEAGFFQQAVTEPGRLIYARLVQFAAFVGFLLQHEGSVSAGEAQEWMRVIFNLSVNSTIDHPDEFGRALAAVRSLLPQSKRILQALAESDIRLSGFSLQQTREEALKARLIIADAGWRSRIDAAEAHGYFKGQIEFLLDFAGVVEKNVQMPVAEWPADLHGELQSRFDDYLAKAQRMFGDDGLEPLRFSGIPYLWERALLVFGSYLSNVGSNQSFLTNPPSADDSWKRCLRGETSGPSFRRRLLKTLWDRLDANADVVPQLDRIIRERDGLDPWREQLVKHPELIGYCDQRSIRRRSGSEEIYLLKKIRLNGAHAELFSLALHLELRRPDIRSELAPLVLMEYQSVANTDDEPFVLLQYRAQGTSIDVMIISIFGMYQIRVRRSAVESLPSVRAVFRDGMRFDESEYLLRQNCSRETVVDVLRDLAHSLAALPAETTAPSEDGM